MRYVCCILCGVYCDTPVMVLALSFHEEHTACHREFIHEDSPTHLHSSVVTGLSEVTLLFPVISLYVFQHYKCSWTQRVLEYVAERWSCAPFVIRQCLPHWLTLVSTKLQLNIILRVTICQFMNTSWLWR